MKKSLCVWLCTVVSLAWVLTFNNEAQAQDTKPINGLNVQAVKYYKADQLRGYFTELTDRTWSQVTPKSIESGTWSQETVTTVWEETNRDEWSVYLRSHSGNATAQIDLWTKKVTRTEGGGSSELAEKLEPFSVPITMAEIASETQAAARGAEAAPQAAARSAAEGGEIHLAPVTNPGPIYVGPNDQLPVASLLCATAVAGDPRDNWMLSMWPSPLTTTSKSLLVEAAVKLMQRRRVAVSDAELGKLVSAIKADPVTRYEFAPFMLGTFFEALVAENPTEAQLEYKSYFEHYQGCADYYRAVSTLREWHQYQGTGDIVGNAPAYKPVLLSSVNFNHTPSISGFIESDPLAFGSRGGEAVALLYLPMAAKNGLMNENPMSGAIASLGDDMTAVAVGAGLGSGAATAAVLMGGTAAYVSAAASAALAGPIAAAQNTLSLAQAALSAAQGAEAVQAAQIGVTTAEHALEVAEAGTVSWGPSLATFAGPAIVVVAAACILGTTIAEVAQKAAFEEKLQNAVKNASFSVAEYLNVPQGERQTRRRALFTLMVKNLIANPVQSGMLSIEMPEYDCPTGQSRGVDKSCVLEVHFHSQAGLTIDQAQELSLKNSWRIASAFEVQRAWEQLGFDAFAYGLLADGRYAVPIQSDMGNFKRGANIGAQGGNQGFFYAPRVEYRTWGGLTLKQAEDITGHDGDRLATAEEVQRAWEKQGLDVFAYGMLADERFAVPIQSDQGNFKRGANIGAQGGNQGFFFVRNAAQTPGDMYYRGQQPLQCPGGTQVDAGLCYQPCDPGYGGVATRCYANCPPGFRDDGLYCGKPEAYTREGFPWQIGDPPLPNYSGPISRCEAKYGGAEVKFHSQAGLSIAQANQIAASNSWRLATADQVQNAWQKGLDVYAFGLMIDGRYAVPVQSDHPNFKRGANIGAQGGNQGFFYTLPACEQAGAIIYPKCKASYHAATVNLCSPDCPSGMTDIGVSCQKNFYDRGTGKAIDTCPAGTEKIGAVCYPLCRSGFRGQLDWCYKE